MALDEEKTACPNDDYKNITTQKTLQTGCIFFFLLLLLLLLLPLLSLLGPSWTCYCLCVNVSLSLCLCLYLCRSNGLFKWWQLETSENNTQKHHHRFSVAFFRLFTTSLLKNGTGIIQVMPDKLQSLF